MKVVTTKHIKRASPKDQISRFSEKVSVVFMKKTAFGQRLKGHCQIRLGMGRSWELILRLEEGRQAGI